MLAFGLPSPLPARTSYKVRERESYVSVNTFDTPALMNRDEGTRVKCCCRGCVSYSFHHITSRCNAMLSLLALYLMCPVTNSAKKRSPGLVNLVLVIAYHFCLALPAASTKLWDHLLAEPCTHSVSATMRGKRHSFMHHDIKGRKEGMEGQFLHFNS